MKFKPVLLAVMTLLITNLYSQKTNFEKGYYINSYDAKIECQIKNEEWGFNPKQFECIVSNETSSRILNMSDIKEIAIGDEFKFKKATVLLDKSNDSFESVTAGKALNLVEETVMLRVRVEGKATLYSYKSQTFTRFFYSLDQGEIKQLSYKVYHDEEENGNRKNEVYKQEILNNLKCDKITQNDIDGLEYKVSSLSDIFVKYNVCVGSGVVELKPQKNIETFEIYAKFGCGLTNFNVDFGTRLDYESKMRYKLGVEAEINLSNKSKKWSLLAEPVYTSYVNTVTSPTNPDAHIKIEYQTLDLSLGLRRYFAVNSKSFVFADIYATYGIPTKRVFDFSTTTTYELNISNTVNPALGIGFLYDKKYSLELRYEFKRNLFMQYSYVDSEFKTVGLVLGYKFL